jgi:hypothetical protein
MSDQSLLTVYLTIVFGLAAVSTGAAIGIVADAAVRTWRSTQRHRAHQGTFHGVGQVSRTMAGSRGRR